MGKIIEFLKVTGEESEDQSCRMSEWLYTLYSHMRDQQQGLAEMDRVDMIENMEMAFAKIPAEVIAHLDRRYGRDRRFDRSPE